MTDIAIAHDQFRTMGGAERVAVEIAREFDCPIYAMRVEKGVPPDDVEMVNLSSRFGEWLMRRHYILQDAYQMFSWQHVPELYEYDTIIQTKTNPGWFVPHTDSQTVVRYCHSTPRGLFDQFHRRGGDLIGDGLKAVQRVLYQQTTPYADRWVCNSDVVKRRVERYADPASADVDVSYPPVEVDKTSPDKAETQDYLFYIGRLAVNKRIGLIRDIAEERDEKVVVAGDGPCREALLENQPENLEYLGYISEAEKWRRLSEGKATLMLAESEDFGITPVESMAAGTPVIGVEEGFTQYQIRHGFNGLLCDPTVDSVSKAIYTLYTDGVSWADTEIAEFAEQFSVNRFRKEIRQHVKRAEQNSCISPDWTVSKDLREASDD